MAWEFAKHRKDYWNKKLEELKRVLYKLIEDFFGYCC